MLDLTQFDFPLPEESIARHPVSPRDDSRLLHVPLDGGPFSHLKFPDLLHRLRPDDLLVLNTTRVVPARLFGTDTLRGRRFEVLLLGAQEGLDLWQCLVKPGRHIRAQGSVLDFGHGRLGTVRRSLSDSKLFEVRFEPAATGFWEWLDRAGEVPLPPYLKREPNDADKTDYQTVYARTPGSVAAPTAGLHFTQPLLAAIRAKGVGIVDVTLHIGYGTFGTLDPSATELHQEWYHVPEATRQAMAATRTRGGRVIAVGTTSLRALESAAQGPAEGTTRLFIKPGYRFLAVDGLITNFHLPQSSLFILVCAFLGTGRAQRAYREALDRKYRFFSYGDAMALL